MQEQQQQRPTIINPYNNKNKLITKNEVQNILKKYDVFNNISNLEVFQQAFIHESYSTGYIRNVIERDGVSLAPLPDGIVPLQPASYERLEFLGDRVIEIVVSTYLFERYSNEDEGFLSRMKVSLVNGLMLGHLARVLGLGKFLIVSKTLEDKECARQKDNLLEDIFEAFIGAIYLNFNNDKPGILASFGSGLGFHIAQKFLINLIEDENSEIDMTELIMDDGNYKNQLVRYFKRVHKSSITFKNVDYQGIGIDKEYIVHIIKDSDKTKIGEGRGKEPKYAHQEGAKNVLISLGLIRV